MTKTQKVLEFFQNGGTLTEAQARARFGVANMSATASNLRQKGFAIFGNPKTLSDGRKTIVYRLGTPPRSVVAAGYRALAQAR